MSNPPTTLEGGSHGGTTKNQANVPHDRTEPDYIGM